jgi:hypothetical protein
MSATHTTLYDTDTDEFLFLTDGIPDILTHSLWRAGALQIYRPGDYPDMFVTIDPHGVRKDWPFTDAAIHRLPPQPLRQHDLAVAARSLPPHPWISYDEVTYGLANDEIVAFDIWRRDPDSVGFAPAPHWEEYLRPVLVRPPPPELTLPLPAPSASSHRDTDAAASVGPIPSAPPIITNTVLPPHIQRLIIDAAITTGATCPITMEPITADTAVITPCGHIFGTELRPRVSICPVCRSAL